MNLLLSFALLGTPFLKRECKGTTFFFTSKFFCNIFTLFFASTFEEMSFNIEYQQLK